MGFEGAKNDSLTLLLSKDCVEFLKPIQGKNIKLEIQFVLERVEMCKMHYVLDQMKENNGEYLVVPEKFTDVTRNLGPFQIR